MGITHWGVLFYHTAKVTELLPGLQLDVLTVEGFRSDDESYKEIDHLLRNGNGLKELRFLQRNSRILGYAFDADDFEESLPEDEDPELYLRQPQPPVW